MHIQFDPDATTLPNRAAHGVRFAFSGPAELRSFALAGTFNSWVGDACMLERLSPTQYPDWYTRDANGNIFYAVPNRDYFAGFDFNSRALRNMQSAGSTGIFHYCERVGSTLGSN